MTTCKFLISLCCLRFRSMYDIETTTHRLIIIIKSIMMSKSRARWCLYIWEDDDDNATFRVSLYRYDEFHRTTSHEALHGCMMGCICCSGANVKHNKLFVYIAAAHTHPSVHIIIICINGPARAVTSTHTHAHIHLTRYPFMAQRTRTHIQIFTSSNPRHATYTNICISI